MSSKRYRKYNQKDRSILGMQIFNGKTKNKFYSDNEKTIMELGAGKLNDLLNWANHNIKYVYAVEIDIESIKLGRKKYEYELRKGHKLPKVKYIKADLTTDVDEVIKKFKKIQNSMDAIYCNMAIHYFAKDHKMLANIIKLVEFFIKPGGKFSYICIEGQMIYNTFKDFEKDPKIIEESDLKTFKSLGANIKMPVEKSYNFVDNNTIVLKLGPKTLFSYKRLYKKLDEFKPFGQQIKAYVKSIGIPHNEYLMNTSYFNEMLKKRFYKLDEFHPFIQYVKNFPKLKLSLAELKVISFHTEYKFIKVVPIEMK